MKRMSRCRWYFVALFPILFWSCKNQPADSSVQSQAASSCASIQAKVNSLEAELRESEEAGVKIGESQTACKSRSGAEWNDAQNRCECVSDRAKFATAAYEILNSFICPQINDPSAACREISGAVWNTASGRCECADNPSNFKEDVAGIRLGLSCATQTAEQKACGDVAHAVWNSSVPRCECKHDLSLFSGNAWSIKNTLKCPSDPATVCSQGGSYNPSLGECTCEDGTAYSSYNGTPCQNGLGLTEAQVGFALTRSIEDIRKDLVAARLELAKCQSTGSQVDAGKTDAGTQPAKVNIGAKNEKPAQPACRCAWDRSGRFCVVWKDGKPLSPWMGPISKTEWGCGDNGKNDPCQRKTLSGLAASAACK